MYFNVSQLLKELSGSARNYEVNDFASLKEDAPLTAISGTVKMLRTDAGIWVSAELEGYFDCECSRCVADMEQFVLMEIEEEYLPELDVNTGARLNFPDEMADNFYIDHSHMLDMSEAIRQYSGFCIPFSPVCRENCKGLCLTCGADLNDTDCPCDNVIRDPRWGPLLAFASPQEPNFN